MSVRHSSQRRRHHRIELAQSMRRAFLCSQQIQNPLTYYGILHRTEPRLKYTRQTLVVHP